MAHLPVIPNTFRVALNWADAGGQTATNVIHILAAGKTSADVAESLDDQAATGLWESAVTSAGVIEYAITPLDGTTATTHYTPATPASWKGSQSGDFSPAVAAIVKFGTGARGRSNRGRLYIPFTAESAQVNGGLDGTIQAAMQSQWGTWEAAMAADGFQHVVASYKLAHENAVTNWQVETFLATQRRRQGRLRAAGPSHYIL